MKVLFHRSFRKQFKRLTIKEQTQFERRLMVLLTEPSHPSLHIHMLRGEKYPLESMNVTGDIRALFIRTKNEVTFYEIGTHSELYE